MKPVDSVDQIWEKSSAARERADSIEAEREAKRQAREEKKLEKLKKAKRELWEKLIAPILLLITVLVSAALYLMR